MNPNEVDRGGDFEAVDADAVCEKCGTVNPEGTLLCRTCGNNLRDQRRNRISADGGFEAFAEDKKERRRQILTGLLTVFGILLVIFVAMSLGNIESWLVQAQTTNVYANGSTDFWNGPEAAHYNQLWDELVNNPIPRARIDESVQNPVNDTAYTGRYVLVRPDDLLGRTRVVGEANLRSQGDVVLIVARLTNRDVQIRGYAELEGEEKRPTVWETLRVRIDGQEYPAYGYAQQLDNGANLITGQTTYSDTTHSVIAYRIR